MRKKIQMDVTGSSKGNGMTLSQGIGLFMAHCVARNLSAETMKTYGHYIDHFTEDVGADTLLSDITASTVEQHAVWLRNRGGNNDVSVATNIRTVRVVLYYLMKSGYMRTFRIQLPKYVKDIKETYTEAELRTLLKKPDVRECSFTTYKTWVMINYLLATGNRLTTMINVRIKDLDFSSGMITLHVTKNKKAQIIPMSHALTDILAEYLQIRGGEPEDYLFCNAYGEQANKKCVQDSIALYNKKRGVEKHSVHLFRHTFAKLWVMNGGDVFRLQKILGHADISTTRQYVNLYATEIQQDYERFSPLDNLRQSDKRISMSRR